MDDFRVSSAALDAAYREQAPAVSNRRKKDKRPNVPASQDGDIVSFSEPSDSDATVEDYYSPSENEPGE